jgi:hypothetical protein
LEANPETGTGQSPFNRLIVTHYSTASAFQASLEGKGDVPLPDFEAIRRACICAWMGLASCANFFFYPDMPFLVDVVFVDG